MEKIDISELIRQFSEHLATNDRTVFSARFGDGKSYFLNEFITSKKDEYEFIVLYPVNYQIAPNDAVMEYIKRDILLQLIIKGYIMPDVVIPEQVLFQWYLSQQTEGFFMDVAQLYSSLSSDNSKWSVALRVLMELHKIISNRIEKYNAFKDNLTSKGTFQEAASIIENLSIGKGNIYELDMVSYLIIQTLQQIKNQGRKSVLIIEDLDRIDPAHLFRILNVFSAHIDRVYQCSPLTVYDKDGNEQQVDGLRNKFGFDKVVMVMDYDTTKYIYSHFYGDKANYQGYIGKFISHNVYRYSISSYARQQLQKHLTKRCHVEINSLFRLTGEKYIYMSPNEISVRCIAQVLDSFKNSIYETPVPLDDRRVFNPSTPLTCTISTLRRLGMNDESIYKFILAEYQGMDLIKMFGLYLLNNTNISQGNCVFYKQKLYQFVIQDKDGGQCNFDECHECVLRNPKQYEFLTADFTSAFSKACSYVK